jgi:hypothetical protein
VTPSLVEEVSLSWSGRALPVLWLPGYEPAHDRRTGMRLPCVLRATIVWSGPWPGLAARVQDVSEGGLGLIVRGRCPSADEAALELHDRTGRCYAQVRGRVTWTARIVPGLWHAGWEVFPEPDIEEQWVADALALAE